LPTTTINALGTAYFTYGIHFINTKYTFLSALSSVDFSTTENVIKKISVLGYASGLNRVYYYCPAVSLNKCYIYHNPKLIILPSTFKVVDLLSKIVGTY